MWSGIARRRSIRADLCSNAHLEPGGGLALNVFHPSLEFMAANAGAYAGVWRWRDTQKREFELLSVSGDFHGRPFERDSDELIVVVRKR